MKQQNETLGEWITKHPYQFCALIGFLIALLRCI
jgi:hypothetical protein